MSERELIEAIQEILDSTSELNMENYTHEEVEALNDAMNEIAFEIEKFKMQSL